MRKLDAQREPSLLSRKRVYECSFAVGEGEKRSLKRFKRDIKVSTNSQSHKNETNQQHSLKIRGNHVFKSHRDSFFRNCLSLLQNFLQVVHAHLLVFCEKRWKSIQSKVREKYFNILLW